MIVGAQFYAMLLLSLVYLENFRNPSMHRLFAIFLILVATIYSDTESGNWFTAFILPVVLVGSLAFLFWLKGFLAILVIALGIYNSNLESSSVLEGIFWPGVVLFAFIYLMIWMAQKASQERAHDIHAGGGHYGGDSFGGDGGCDGGGGGD